MKVALRVSLILGMIGFILTYGFSIVNNTWLPSLFRAVIGFVFFIVLGYILQYVLQFIGLMKDTSVLSEQNQNQGMEGLLDEAGTVAEKEEAGAEQEQAVEPLFQSIPLEMLQKGKNNL